MTTTVNEEPRSAMSEETSISVLALGLHDGPARRLAEAGVVEVVENADAADLAVVSTRIPRRQSATAIVADLTGGRPDLPVYVLAHPGGEDMAVEFLRSGAHAVVAEGNESQLLGWVRNQPLQESLLETYERRLERKGAVPRQGVTLGRSPFESRVYELAQGGTTPRIALARVKEWGQGTARLSVEALELLERRLDVQFEDLTRSRDAEMFRIAAGSYGMIGRELSATGADSIGRELEAVAGSFSPGRTTSLGLAMGHVGPEVTSDPATLLEMARRALELADSDEGPSVVNADDMSRTLASSTELDTVFRTKELVEQADPAGGAHGDRVAEIATRLAERLGLEGRDVTWVRLACQLHDIGKVSLAEEEAFRFDSGSDRYRRHPELGATALRAAGEQVVSAIRHHHERWDGEGFPDGLAGEEIPIGARLTSIADAVDRWIHPDGSVEEAVSGLEAGAGNAFDPELARIAIEVLSSS